MKNKIITHHRCTLKLFYKKSLLGATILILGIFLLSFVSAETNSSIMYGQNDSGAIIPLKTKSDGTLKINLNFLNISAGDIRATGNLSLGQKITFALGETIDNIADGWIRVTGGLNVTTGNFSLGGKLLSNEGGILKWGGTDVSTNISILYAENTSGGMTTLKVADSGALKLDVSSAVSDNWDSSSGITQLTSAGNVKIDGDVNITGDLFVTGSGAGSVPENSVVSFNQASCPAGWVLADGTGGTPDLRGIFVRGAGTSGVIDYANGTDMSATYGTYGNDSFQGHWHEVRDHSVRHGIYDGTNTEGGSASNIKYTSSNADTALKARDIETSNATTIGNPRTGAETAPASYALIYCVKTAEDTAVSTSIWQTSGHIILPVNSSKDFAINNSNFYVNVSSGNVGIGTNSPSAELDMGTGDILMGTNGKIFGNAITGNRGEIELYNNLDGHMTLTTTFGTADIILMPAGNVGIGKTSPQYALDVYDNGASYAMRVHSDGASAANGAIRIHAGADDGSGTTTYLRFDDGDATEVGGVEHNSGTVQIYQASDERLKENIVDASINGLDIINNLQVREFDWIKNSEHTTGFIAQELEQVYPIAVQTRESEEFEDGLKTISKTQLIEPLVKAIQELSSENDELKEIICKRLGEGC